MMDGWNEVKLEEIAEVVGGGTPSSKEDSYWNGDVNWVTPADLSGYMFKHISYGERKITKLGLSKSSAKLHPKGTVLMTSRAPIGYLAIAGDEVATNQGFQSLRCKTDKVDNNFLYYILHLYKEGIQAIASGATFPEISGKKVKGFKIKIPPLLTQRKIASILSAYDDLIENNLKRIKLLEEKAQLTYEEWFVRKKFPGHETASINDETGLPEGWKKEKIRNISKTSSGGTPSRKKEVEYYENGTIPWVRTGELKNFILTDAEYYITESGLKNSSAKLFPKNTVLLAMYGNTIGETSFVTKEVSSNQACCAFLVKDKPFLSYFLHQYLLYHKKYILNFRMGAAQENISQSIIQNIKIIFPKEDLLLAFEKETKPIYEEIENMIKQNEILKEARDILLPRLMTGMIDVDQIQLENR